MFVYSYFILQSKGIPIPLIVIVLERYFHHLELPSYEQESRAPIQETSRDHLWCTVD